jgi:hypothetical protein
LLLQRMNKQQVKHVVNSGVSVIRVAANMCSVAIDALWGLSSKQLSGCDMPAASRKVA